MEIKQVAFTLKPRKRGFHLITQEILANLPALPQAGLLNLFVKHTSCALSINENYDPSVRTDMEYIYNCLVPDNAAFPAPATPTEQTIRQERLR